MLQNSILRHSGKTPRLLPLTLLLVIAGTLPGWGQGRVSNVRMKPMGQQAVEIRYDLKNTLPTDSIYVRLQRRNGKFIPPTANSVTGDVGMNLPDGRDRRIIWDLRRNGLLLREEVRPVVLLKPGGTLPRPAQDPTPKTLPAAAEPRPDTVTTPTVAERTYRGPAWALLSVLAPGIGNIFVQTPKPRVGFRPLVTVAAYGLLIYGAGQQGEADQTYNAYLDAGSEAAAEPFYQKANSAHQHYYVATRAAAAIWITDVTLTFIRGLRNQRADRQAGKPVSLHLNYQANTPVAVVRYSF